MKWRYEGLQADEVDFLLAKKWTGLPIGVAGLLLGLGFAFITLEIRPRWNKE